jgi:uncharacterized protein YbjT (DUF2867 family)
VKAIVFGASGMVGQGVLRECLLDPHVAQVLSIVRSPTTQPHSKLIELVRKDLFAYDDVESQFAGYDACLFCLGVTSSGMTEQEYSHVTYDLTMAAARALVRLNPTMTFIYVSGQGTDTSEKGGSMWARLKGKTENALLGLPFKAAYMFRPGLIQPMHGIQSKTSSYRVMYAIAGPLLPALRRLFPQYVTTTELLARAMMYVAQNGYAKRILESRDINEAAAATRSS